MIYVEDINLYNDKHNSLINDYIPEGDVTFYAVWGDKLPGTYKIDTDDYLTAFRVIPDSDDPDISNLYVVEFAYPGDSIQISYNDFFNDIIPDGKYIKDISCSGIDDTSEGFTYEKYGSNVYDGLGIKCIMPENDMSFSTVLSDIKLSTPVNLRWEGTKCVWDSVEGAGFYWLKIVKDGQNLSERDDFSTVTNSYDLSQRVLDRYGSGTYTVSVCAFNASPISGDYNIASQSDFSKNSPEYVYDVKEYNINLDNYLIAGYGSSIDGYYKYNIVDSAAPGKKIDVYFDGNVNNSLPKGKYIKEIKFTGIDTNAEGFEYIEEYDGANAAVHFIMPENDVTLSSVLADAKKYEIDLSKGKTSIPENVFLSFYFGAKFDFIFSEDNQNDPYEYIDLDNDKIADIKTLFSPIENDEEPYVQIEKLDGCKLKGNVEIEVKDTERPKYYFTINFGDAGNVNNNSDKNKSVATVNMYRLYNPNSGEHFYTANEKERNNLVSVGWRYEGIGWKAPAKSNTPVYRLYNKNAGDHHYTMSEKEKDFLVSVGWKYEGIGWYSDDAKSVPLYRQYNPNAKAGSHNYTTSKAENDKLVGLGWKGEGVGWYGVK
ncbi:MAG: hypothetical protein IJ224_11970 [Lachnospiraceae bacterium]|nr:hypothetical protein [Lachnospiraceae bacterium]